jgi:quercetin dioxygenase-like cupin family protein
MKFAKLDDFVRGWIVGKFSPNLYNKDYEVGFKSYKQGDYEKAHKHELSEEVTIILFGEVEMNGDRYKEGDIVIQEKGEYTDFKAISERVITAIFRPDGSFPNDKYFKEE